MSDKTTAATPEAATPPPAPQGVSEAEVAQRETAARAEARTAERARIAGILQAPEATGRAGLAQALAFESDMAPEAAVKLLAAAAQEQPPAPAPAAAAPRTSPLAAAMAGVPNAAVGPDTSATTAAAEADSAEALAASAITLARRIQGVKA